jgi:hypothetical protein
MQATADLSPIVELAVFAQLDFNYAIDYVWKAPTLIEALTKIEGDKLREYSDPSRARELRRMEQLKLKRLFPALVSQGNLFVVCSLFEAYVLQLATESQKFVDSRLDETAGKGITRWLTYLRRIGVETQAVSPWPQVEAALRIRNCLIHAQGALRLSKDETEIRRIVKSRTFLELRLRKRSLRHPVVRVEIVQSALGDRLEITNGYSWLAGAYLRDYFSNLCQRTAARIKASD